MQELKYYFNILTTSINPRPTLSRSDHAISEKLHDVVKS